jgi:hypothetical protein
MLRSRRFKWVALLATFSAGTMLQFSTGCNQFWTDVALTSFDFCSVVNCTGGTYFNGCDPVLIRADCPNATAP